MTTVLAWRNLVEYARRPLNLILLAVVPVVFVSLSAGVIADFARILGGEAGIGQLEVTTAGWAAAFLAGVAAFFHVNGSRAADRRLASADGSSVRVVTARLGSSLLLAAVATAGALLALALRTDIVDVPRAVGATGMFAIIYLGIGASIGALVRSEVNGSLVIVFIWMFDVFLGPAMGESDAFVTRLFPSHFPTLVMLDASTTHAGPLGDIGASLVWTLGGLALAFVTLLLTLVRSVHEWHIVACTATVWEPAGPGCASVRDTFGGSTDATLPCGSFSLVSRSSSSRFQSSSPPTSRYLSNWLRTGCERSEPCRWSTCTAPSWCPSRSHSWRVWRGCS